MVITVLSLLALVALLVGIAASPLFAARTITVAGEEHLSEAEVLAAAGVDEQTNVLFLSTGEVESTLRANPWIATASVQRSIPSTLAIGVHERVAGALARVPDGYAVIASDGVTLGTVPRDADVPDLPQIRGGRPALPGQRSEQIAGAAAAAAAWDETVRAEDPELTVAPDGTIEIELAHGIPVLYGDARDPGPKAEALAGVLRWADEHHQRIVSIDVRIPYGPSAEFEGRGGVTEEAEIDPETATTSDNRSPGDDE